MSTRLTAAMLAASACAAPIAESAAPVSPVSPCICPPESFLPETAVTVRCRAVADKLRGALANDASVCAEDNSVHGARAAELNGACGNDNSADRAIRNDVRWRLDEATRYCFGLEQARRLRQAAAPPDAGQPAESDKLTIACEKTLSWIDKVLGETTRSRCDDNNGPDGLRWYELARNCKHWSSGKTALSFPSSAARQRAEALEAADASCRQTHVGYRGRYGDRGSN